ncbi:hypothetical protein MHBO_003438 [Bonamia ostreae]|uniref:PUB domain-containing protein n=1 Tax=Bonamia ostreae TaxID=126728 RepID=A0ABV2AR72_9EUKA
MTEYKTKNKKIEDYMKIRAEIDSCLYNLAKEIPYEKLKKSFNLILLILQNAFIGKDKKKRSLKKSNSKIQNLLVFENFKRLIKILGFVEQSDEIILNTKNQNKFCDFGAYSIEYIKQINIENFIEQKVTTPNLVEREIKLITKAKTQKTEANPNSETDSDSETEKALLIQSFERKKAEFVILKLNLNND